MRSRPIGPLLARIADEATLIASWSEIRERAYAKPNLDTRVQAFDRGVLARLTDIAQRLREGSWRPGPLAIVDKPEEDGDIRRLHVPTVEDRVVERAALMVLEPLIDPQLSPFSFAYRSGLGVRDALRQLAAARDEGMRWCVRADIKDCFDSIPRMAVLDRLEEIVADESALRLIRLLLTRPVEGETARSVLGRGLSQGCALSPVLCNLYLDAFDRAMLSRAWRLCRYSDDFAVPAVDRSAAADALDAIRECLRAIGMEPNEDKTRIVSFDEGVPFLGSIVGASDSRGKDDSAHPLEATLYVTEQGALVRSRGDRIRVTAGGKTLFSAGFGRLRQVVCVGRVGMTTPLIHRALTEDVDVVLLNSQGAFLGRLSAGTTGNVELRRAQYRAADDPARQLSLARAIVAGKIANLRTMLQRGARGSDDAAELGQIAERLAARRSATFDVTSLPELMGLEGAATRDYFSAFDKLVGPPWTFTGRQRRPPPDPVNAMLSFGYTLLAEDAVSALQIAGLDPEAGFLHAASWGRPSLALDLMEQFRPLVVDVAVTRLARTGQISPADFVITETDGCRMNATALDLFLAAYERRMLTLVSHPATDRRVSYRVALLAQARAIAHWIVGRNPDYRPMPWR